MEKYITKIVAVIMAVFLLGFAIPASAAGDTAASEVVISSIQNKDPLVAGKKIDVEVYVQRDNPNDPMKTVKDEDKALVYVFFTKGKDTRQAEMKLKKNGLYDGTITLPTAGEWKVNAMALVPDPKLGKNGTNTMKTTWNIQEPHTPIWVWVLIVVGVLLVIAIIYFIIKGVQRKKRLKAERKAMLQQQKKNRKNKKSKKKR